MRLAALLLLAAIAATACRSNRAEEPDGAAEAATVEEQGALDEASSASVAKIARRRGPPPTRWAMWPMPNFASSGLPHPESYDSGVAGTVLDRVTGLMWQRSVKPGNVTFDDANAICEQLELGGYRDWRLPSRIELVSILDMAETQPSIDRTAFPDTPSDWFWSASVGADGPTSAWYVYFYFGYPKTDEQRSRFRTRCVRTGKPPAFTGSPDAHYDVASNTVHDLGTGLTWQRAVPPSSFAFQDALAYCGHLDLDGHKDWRLPSMPELVSLVDERASNPAIDAKAFAGTPAESFWTSSLFGDKWGEAWHVYFDYGSALYGLLKVPYRVRCVR